MRVLRLTHSASADVHRVAIEVEVPGLARRTATARFTFVVPAKEQELIRWYFEDYRLRQANAVTRPRAGRAGRRLVELGGELSGAVFEASPATRSLWAAVQPQLDEFRVEIVTDVAGATSLPWEAMTEPGTRRPLALSAGAMVRAQPQAALAPVLPEAGAGIRVLVVIARPHVTDVPFRSVAQHLVRLQEGSSQALHLDVLRPPAFAELTRVLQAARDRGAPYRVLHFDGHGVWGDPASGWLGQVISAAEGGPADVWLASPARPGAHGYLLFENPALPGNAQLVDGPALANLLTGAGVSLLTLNACRSALAEPASLPVDGLGDPHAQVRAFGSLAQEVMDAGAAGVLAMRYNVYVATAARLVADVYTALVSGESFGAAVRAARISLAASPPSDTGAAIQDWMVPVAYEAAPLRLTTPLPPKDHDEPAPASAAQQATISLPGDALPPSPALGFYGRDDTLLALDRAFDTQPVVLLHGGAGIGKTATAAEFARWYIRTGGVGPPVVYTSLAQHATMTGLATSVAALAAGGPAAAPAPSGDDRAGEQHLQPIGQLMRHIPMLWILDDVETVCGYRDQSSAWVAEDRQELLTFLRSARDTKTRLLLLSRHDEQAWLGDLPARVHLPALPSADRSLLVQAVTATHHIQLTSLSPASIALRTISGNPRTIIHLTEQALRAGCTTDTELDIFLAQATGTLTPAPSPESDPGTDTSRPERTP